MNTEVPFLKKKKKYSRGGGGRGACFGGVSLRLGGRRRVTSATSPLPAPASVASPPRSRTHGRSAASLLNLSVELGASPPSPRNPRLLPLPYVCICRDTTSLVSTMSQTTCSCAENNCFEGNCDCLISVTLCSRRCNCHGVCQNGLSLGSINPASAQVTAPTVAPGSSASHGAPVEDAEKAVAAQPKPLAVPEPGTGRKVCGCPNSKCKNSYCICRNAGMLCCAGCHCIDCGNTKSTTQKRKVPASGPGPMQTRARVGQAQAANEADVVVGCSCKRSKCGRLGRCRCVWLTNSGGVLHLMGIGVHISDCIVPSFP